MVGADGAPGLPVGIASGLPVDVEAGLPVGAEAEPALDAEPGELAEAAPPGVPPGCGPPAAEDELIDGAAPDTGLVSAGDDGLIGGDGECSTAAPVSCSRSDEETSPEPGVDRRLVPADLGDCVICSSPHM